MTSLRTAQRGENFFDTFKDGGIVTRTVRNHCSYNLPGRPLQETKLIIEAAEASVGSFDPMRKQEQAPLQCYVGDAHDPDYQCAASCRPANDPVCQIDMRPIDAMPSRLREENGAFKFPGVWLHTTKFYRPAPNKLLGTLKLLQPGHPATFRYSLDVPDGMRIEFANDTARILDDQGVEKMHILAPQGWDSSTVNPESMDGRKPVRVTMREAGTIRVGGRTCVVVELEPNKDDLAAATYPVDIEKNPTVQITGIVDIEDTSLWGSFIQFTYNYGGLTSQFVSAPGAYYRNALTRISATSIPAGTITGFRAYLYRQLGTGETGKVYFVADSNDWVEGTASGSSQVGSACWNQCKYQQQNWAGHPTLGCMVSGTDYDADGSPPTFTINPGWNTATLDPAWPPLWRDAVRAANGMIFFKDVPFHMGWYSSEDGTYPQYFEIDYELPAAGSPATMLSRRIHE